MTIKLHTLWLTGFTRRWHQNAAMAHIEDINAAHQGRCGQLVITLFPDHSIDLLRAAITHDAPEYVVGDLAGDFKAAGGEAVESHAALEAEVLADMGFNWKLDRLDRIKLKLVDRLDAYLFVALRNSAEITRNGWVQGRKCILDAAYVAGVSAQVERMIADAEGHS